MKKYARRFWWISSTVGIAIIMVGCCGTPDSPYRNYTVTLKPSDKALEITSDPQGWEANKTWRADDGKQTLKNKKGYVGFERNTYGSILLALEQFPSGSTCTDDPGTWVITRIALSKNGNRNTQKGNNFGSNQSGWLTNAFPQADENGIVLDVDKSAGVASFLMHNSNNDEGKQWAYYEVTATRCSDGATATTDPAIQNGGHD